MIGIAALWIGVLLLGGALALDRVLVNSVESNFDNQLNYVLTAMIASAEVAPDGEVRFSRPLGDQRFMEPNSGFYWQIRGRDYPDYPSRSLWDRTLPVDVNKTYLTPHFSDVDSFQGATLRMVERTIILPDSDVRWNFAVAQSTETVKADIKRLRSTLLISFAILGIGLVVMAALQTLYGLWPLRSVRQSIAEMRSGRKSRITDSFPEEVMPMVGELNALLDHNERQAEEARRHAGNLAHALKTPLTVVMNAATAKSPDLDQVVMRESTTMRRQVDHHLARARAVGRRGHAHSRAQVWDSLESVERAVGRLYDNVRLDVTGAKDAIVACERQDLDEMIGNLVENAAKYGGGSVFVTVEEKDDRVEIQVEDDGMGIPEVERERIFARGARLDTGKPGTGLGLAIVRDVAEIYEGGITLEESEDLGGLLARLWLPKAAV